MDITKEFITIKGQFTGKISYGIAKAFEWKEYRYKNKYYNVSQFNNEVHLIGGYCDISGSYKKSINY